MAVWKPNFGEYQWVWDAVCYLGAGEAWPQGNEDDLWALSEQWVKVSDTLGAAIEQADKAAIDLVKAWDGDDSDAFDLYWRNLGLSPDAGLGALQDVCSTLGVACDGAALELEYAKLTVLISVIITVISVFIALVMAFLSFGTSSAAIPPIIAGGRTAVWLAIKQLIQKLMTKIAAEGLKQVLKQAGKKLGKELAKEVA